MFYSHELTLTSSTLFFLLEIIKKKNIFRCSSLWTPPVSVLPPVAPPLLVPLSLAVPLPHPLPLSVAAGSAALAVPLSLTLTAAAHHGLCAPQEVVHTHVVVVLGGQ